MSEKNEAATPIELRVLYRDELVLALDKPPRVLSVPGRDEDSTGPALSQLVRSIAEDALPVHRLDRDTSGVLLFALGREAHRALNRSFESRKAEKKYLALCEGDLAAAVVCELALIEARSGGVHIVREEERGSKRALEAITAFAPLERFGSATLIEARPRTGRTHQIRAHLAAIGHPLLIDPRYRPGDRTVRPLAWLALDRTPLHAAAIRIPHPSGRGFLQIESPMPIDITRALDQLRAARRLL